MSNRRRAGIDRSATYDDDETPPLTVKDADAALYGALSRVDGKRKAIERTRFGAFKITPRGLEIGEGADKKDWDEAGQFIFQVESGIQWLIGDWLAYGDQVGWGDIPKLSKSIGRDEATLHNYSSVSRKVQFSLRSENLSYNHHVLVAPYTPQEQVDYLYYAERGEEKILSVARFRAWIKEQRGEESGPALSSNSSYVSVRREFEKLMQRNPATAKEQEHEKARKVLAEMQAVLRAFSQQWGID